MPTKEEEFKQRFATVLRDLEENGKDDGEAMWLLGSLAAGLIDKAGKKSWTEFKRDMSRETYDALLADFQKEGNRQHSEGDPKKAYAIQALAVSLIAMTQKDPQIAAGSALLDGLLGQAIAIYRKAAHLGKPVVN